MNRRISQHDFSLNLEKKSNTSYAKMSFPVHCGIYTILETDHYIFHFNLNHEIIRIKDKSGSWNHPHEWLQRTMGNDWVYYSTGGYTGVFEATGEYYLPNFQYSSNSVLGGNPFSSNAIRNTLDNWYSELESLVDTKSQSQEDITFLSLVLHNGPLQLSEKAKKFHDIIGGPISVLPPDARHVGYNLIPLMISRGCLYKCRFCKVKNKYAFKELEHKAIDLQIDQLRLLYGNDLINQNSIYLGEHDALNANAETILYGIEKAYTNLNLYESYLDGVNCFLFGSATSVLEASDKLFDDLQKLPGKTYINVGLESPDQETLDQLGKPISSALVWKAFMRIQALNKAYTNIEITTNLIMDESLPPNHYKEIEKLLRGTQTFQQNKGAIYFSPLRFDSPSRARLFEFNRLKLMSRYPTYLYIIQKL